ncbi:MAG: M20/M25/M40 family metallo-hydrolase [Pirellulales bacterium]|nr:M20/M25/M40 family metallo-hydrolase [Pirellulales bacterium]
MNAPAIELLGRLIAAASVNPRLAGDDPAAAGEQRLTELLIDHCRSAGWPWALQPVHPGRSNLLALVPGDRGDVLLWDVHQDTVSGAGMCIAPFEARVADGRVYGRGACDVKGAMAAMLSALSRASAEPPGRRPSVLLACTVNEECGFTGARALAELWHREEGLARPPRAALDEQGGLTSKMLRTVRPAAAVVAEPTELNVVVSHRGVVRWQCAVEGRAAHSSKPEDGVNAIYVMAEVVRLIRDYYQRELRPRQPDPWCGPPTASVTTIRGGTGPNTIPDRAVIDVDRRLTPDELPAAAYEDMIAHLAERTPLGGARLRHDPPWMESRGLSASDNRALADQVAHVARSLQLEPAVMGVPYGANAASIAAAGIPTVIFGPGSIAQAHTADEWIALEQLQLAEEAYYQIACGALSR